MNTRVSLSIFLSFSLFVLIASNPGCQSSPNFLPFNQEKQLGEQAYAEIKKTEKISKDPRINEIVVRIGKQIAAAANRPEFEWEFTVFESSQINAFCLPGGKVGVYTGILPVAANEAGLAVIMGHEVAHATEHHGAKRVSQGLLIQGGLALTDLLLLKDNKFREIALPLLGITAAGAVALPFSRHNENDADAVGVRFMAQAGWDPSEAPELWRRFAKAKDGKGPPEFMSTHPSDQTRIQRLTELQSEALALYENSPKFGKGKKL